MRGIWSSLCKCHSLRTTYHSKTEWVPYQRKLSHKSTGQFLTINQSCSQQSAWYLNRPAAQRSHPVCKIVNSQWCSVFLCCKKLKHENTIMSNKKNQFHESNPNSNICKILHLPFKMLCYSAQIKMVSC